MTCGGRRLRRSLGYCGLGTSPPPGPCVPRATRNRMRFGNPPGSRRGLRTTPRPPLLAPEGTEVVAAPPRERRPPGQSLAPGRRLDRERQREGRRPLLIADPVDGRAVATCRPSYEIIAAAVLRHPAPELHRA